MFNGSTCFKHNHPRHHHWSHIHSELGVSQIWLDEIGHIDGNPLTHGFYGATCFKHNHPRNQHCSHRYTELGFSQIWLGEIGHTGVNPLKTHLPTYHNLLHIQQYRKHMWENYRKHIPTCSMGSYLLHITTHAVRSCRDFELSWGVSQIWLDEIFSSCFWRIYKPPLWQWLNTLN